MKSNSFSALLSVAAALVLSLGLGQTLPATAAPAQQPNLAPRPYAFHVAAGQTYSGVVRGYCLDFGKEFPTGSLNIKTGQDTKLGGALAYAVDKGYADSNYQQTALALWYLSDSTWHDSAITATDHTVAQEIATAASTTTPATGSGDISLLDATANNQVQARIEGFHALDGLSSGNYYGEGTLVVTNTGSSPLSIYLPYGTIAPAASTTMQNMLLYAAAPKEAPASSSGNTSDTLPTTGGGDGLLLGLALLGLSLLLVAGGYTLRKSEIRG